MNETIRDGRGLQANFRAFKQHLLERFSPRREIQEAILQARTAGLYDLAGILAQTPEDFSWAIAEFVRLAHAATLPEDAVYPNLLPQEFCRHNSVAPLLTGEGQTAFLISNPFDLELIDILKKKVPPEEPLRLLIADPGRIAALLDRTTWTGRPRPDAAAEQRDPRRAALDDGGEEDQGPSVMTRVIEDVGPVSEAEIEQRPVVYVANNILSTAIVERASDIHIEPKETETVVRYRIDGDLRDLFHLRKQTGTMVISRLKALAGLDIAERLKPQDGAVEITMSKRNFKLRLATTSTQNGESLIIRVLEPAAKPKPLQELGMTEAQVRTMADFSTRRYGLILVVGPTGSGKTTTIYSFLSHVDTKTRSLISVEDPVEYRIPNANQQQVNEKAGVTFDALLRSSVRQDPDILYLGEVRDTFSARMSVDFASTGHMTISTLHTNNATTAIFRLERLGITREVMAEALLGIIAQRLLKKLCPICKRIAPLTAAEAEILSPFTSELPTHVAHPVGCPQCRDGYLGREGVYEIIAFDADLLDRIRTGMPISELRGLIQRRGDYLISHHAVEKVKALLIPVKDALEKVLIEEIQPAPREEIGPDRGAAPEAPRDTPAILVVEDDEDNQVLITRLLTGAGYEVAAAADGIDALMTLGQRTFDLILSDINMPNLDGFKFLEILNQKGIQTPLVFLTARLEEADEVKGMEMGAVDYLKKPIKKDALLIRVKRVLQRGGQERRAGA